MPRMSNANDKREKWTNSMHILRKKNRNRRTEKVAKVKETGGMKQIKKELRTKRRIIKEKEKKAKETNTKNTKLFRESGVV